MQEAPRKAPLPTASPQRGETGYRNTHRRYTKYKVQTNDLRLETNNLKTKDMKITPDNYFETIAKIGAENLSPALQKGHELIERATKNGTDWSSYNNFRKQFDLTFEVLSRFIEISEKNKRQDIPKSQAEKPIAPPKQKVIKPYSAKHENSSQVPHKKSGQSAKSNKVRHLAKLKVKGKGVELISTETAFVRRFAALHGKTKSKDQVLSFIRSLQKAIVEKRIRKFSKHAKLIGFIQKQLVNTFQKMGKDVTFEFSDADLIKYRKIGGGQVVMNSVRFIKAYIQLHKTSLTKEKAKKLFNRIADAIERKQLSSADKYFKHIRIILSSLERFVKQKGSAEKLPISEMQLSGLEGVLSSCGCDTELKGFDDNDVDDESVAAVEKLIAPRNKILSSQQVIDLKTDKLNFSGKWLTFIGNPSRGFTAMIYGKPKFGKSYLAIDFAGYLARYHGKVLYIAYEEGFDDTLKQKLQEKNVAHPNLFVSDYLPSNLSEYDFVFIDSVNKAALSPEDLDRIERKNNGTSFIYIFQTTKDGNFKGAMEYKHNVDVIIEVPQRGIATQFGRYNQGGEMRVFG